MSEYVRAIAASDLPPGQGTEVTVGGERVALFNVEGRYHAVSNRCPHRGGPWPGLRGRAGGQLPLAQLDLRRHHRHQHHQRRHAGAVPRGEGRGRAGLRPHRAGGRGVTSPRLVLALLATAGLVHAQEAVAPAEQVPTFAAEIEQVIVDLVIVDKEGDPVSGVTGDDLVITEDDVEQSVVSFEAVALPDEPADKPPPPPRVSANTGIALDRGRTFVIVFDDVHLTPFTAQQARGAVAQFLRSGPAKGTRSRWSRREAGRGGARA